MGRWGIVAFPCLSVARTGSWLNILSTLRCQFNYEKLREQPKNHAKCLNVLLLSDGGLVTRGQKGEGRQKKIRVPEPGTIYDTLVKIAELQPHPLHSNKLQHRPPPSHHAPPCRQNTPAPTTPLPLLEQQQQETPLNCYTWTGFTLGHGDCRNLVLALALLGFPFWKAPLSPSFTAGISVCVPPASILPPLFPLSFCSP